MGGLIGTVLASMTLLSWSFCTWVYGLWEMEKVFSLESSHLYYEI